MCAVKNKFIIFFYKNSRNYTERCGLGLPGFRNTTRNGDEGDDTNRKTSRDHHVQNQTRASVARHDMSLEPDPDHTHGVVNPFSQPKSQRFKDDLWRVAGKMTV